VRAGRARHSDSRVPQDRITITHCIRCGGIRDPLISKHLLISARVLLVSITKSDEQSLARYATHPHSLRQETLRIALATPKLPLSHPWNLIRSYGATHFTPDPPRARNPHSDERQSIPRVPAEPLQRPRDTESPRSFRPLPIDREPYPNDLHAPCPPWYPPPSLKPHHRPKPSEASCPPPLPSATRSPEQEP